MAKSGPGVNTFTSGVSWIEDELNTAKTRLPQSVAEATDADVADADVAELENLIRL